MHAPAVILLWGVGMGLIGAVGVLFFGFEDVETPALFGGVAATMIALGIGLRLSRLGVSYTPPVQTMPDISPATVWLGVSLVLLAISTELGFWLALIAGGMVAAGIGGLVRELRAQREAAEGASAEE